MVPQVIFLKQVSICIISFKVFIDTHLINYIFEPVLVHSFKEKKLLHLLEPNMKPKKKKRAFTATDTLWKLVEAAAKGAGLSVNEWVTTAINTQLKEGVHGEGLDIDAAGELAKATAINLAVSSADKLQAALDKHSKFWAEQMAKLKEQNKNIK